MHLFHRQHSNFKVKVKDTKCTYRSLLTLTKNPSDLYILHEPVLWVKICGRFLNNLINKKHACQVFPIGGEITGIGRILSQLL